MAGIIPPGGAGGVGPSGDPQVTFANSVAAQTGLDPRVVYAWTVVENANAKNGTGHFNFLNLRPYAGDPYFAVSSGGFEEFSTVDDAITATVARIRQPFAAGIRQSVKQSPASQITAIGVSAWDSGHYASGGRVGGSILSQFASLYGSSTLGTAPETQPLPAGGAGKSGDQTQLNLDPLGIGAFLGKLTNPAFVLRGLQVVAGGFLVLVGIYLLARQVGLAPDAPSAIEAAAVAVPK